WFVEQMRKPSDPAAEARPDAFEAEKAALLHVQSEGDPLTAPHGPDELSRLPSVLSPEEKFQAELERLLPLAATDPQARQRALVVMNELLRLVQPHERDRLHTQLFARVRSITAYERVLANPRSLSAREALAAECYAASDPRAELIDLQLRYRKHRIQGTTWADEANAQLGRIYQLTQQHGKTWAGEVAALVTKFEFHRGCVAEVTLPGASFASALPKLMTLAPIQHVNLTTPLEFAQVVASPALARITSLKAVTLGAAFGDTEAAQLAASPHARNLSWVRLMSNAIGEAGVEALAASPHLATCAYLDLEGNPVNPTPYITDHNDNMLMEAMRSGRAAALERKYGPRPWLALPTDVLHWPAHRDDISTTA
ncbi:MAG: hypothetical protein LC747_05400, partial [Acidobacteria bacterium]|nr:hypothetical protein [Acidobacteriota bacterium]